MARIRPADPPVNPRRSRRESPPTADVTRRPAIATRSSRRSDAPRRETRSSRSAWPRLPSAAGVTLAQLRGEFALDAAILAAHLKAVDRAVLAEDLSDMAEEPPRERLFDVLMRRLERLAPHREAVRSLHALGRAQSAARPCAQRARGAVAAMDADGRRHQRLRPARHDARAGPCRCCSLRCCAPGSMTTIPGWRAPWRRSTGRSPAASALSACSTICAACRRGFAGCAARRRRGDDDDDRGARNPPRRDRTAYPHGVASMPLPSAI